MEEEEKLAAKKKKEAAKKKEKKAKKKKVAEPFVPQYIDEEEEAAQAAAQAAEAAKLAAEVRYLMYSLKLSFEHQAGMQGLSRQAFIACGLMHWLDVVLYLCIESSHGWSWSLRWLKPAFQLTLCREMARLRSQNSKMLISGFNQITSFRAPTAAYQASPGCMNLDSAGSRRVARFKESRRGALVRSLDNFGWNDLTPLRYLWCLWSPGIYLSVSTGRGEGEG